jgi:hypothetical protein
MGGCERRSPGALRGRWASGQQPTREGARSRADRGSLRYTRPQTMSPATLRVTGAGTERGGCTATLHQHLYQHGPDATMPSFTPSRAISTAGSSLHPTARRDLRTWALDESMTFLWFYTCVPDLLASGAATPHCPCQVHSCRCRPRGESSARHGRYKDAPVDVVDADACGWRAQQGTQCIEKYVSLAKKCDGSAKGQARAPLSTFATK